VGCVACAGLAEGAEERLACDKGQAKLFAKTGYYARAVRCTVLAAVGAGGEASFVVSEGAANASHQTTCVTIHKCAGDSADEICNPFARAPPNASAAAPLPGGGAAARFVAGGVENLCRPGHNISSPMCAACDEDHEKGDDGLCRRCGSHSHRP
jgi:hypothetical protein